MTDAKGNIMKTLQLIYAGTFLLIHGMANAECVAPDIYTMGTGISLSGLCTAISTGETALSTANIDTATTELSLTQLKSYAMQAEQLAQQTLATQNAIIQAELMVKEFEENPLEVVMPNVTQLIANQERIMKLASDISKNADTVGTNALKNLENPSSVGLGQGSRFQIWSDARRQQALAAFDLANRYMKEAPDRNANINKLINSSAAAQGDTANLKIMSSTVSQSMQFLQGIQEALNGILTGQATETGKRVDDEIQAAKANQNIINNGIGDPLDIPTQDSYIGPGSKNSMPF